MILVRHYCAALLGALFIHLSAVLLLSYSSAGGALDKGEHGIEVDLGMLGELGSAVETQQSSASEAPAIETVAASKEATAEPFVEHIQEEIKASVEVKQTAEIRVKQEPVRKINRAIDAPDAALPTEEKEAQIQKTATASLAVSRAASTVATNQLPRNETSSLKMSTGSGDTLTAGGSRAYKQSYYALIAATLAKHKRYPQYARNKGQEGTVLIRFTVLRSGLVKNVEIKESSGYRQLDRAVKKMVSEASPLPPFPAQQSSAEIIISIPIVFKLN